MSSVSFTHQYKTQAFLEKVEREKKKKCGTVVGAVWVKDQNGVGTRKMFRLGWGACQNNQALAFDKGLLVQHLKVTRH